MFPYTAPSCAETEPATVHWLWKPYLARGKLTLLDGDPGTGKSFVTLDVAARLSRSAPFPDGPAFDRPVSSLILSAEDDAADTIRPRAAAAGADLTRIHVASDQGQVLLPQFPNNAAVLKQMVVEYKTFLVVIDPLMAFFPPDVWANNDQSVRKALGSLAEVAAATGCAILMVRHLAKTGGAKAIYRGSGSIGIIGAARTALMLGRHPDDPDIRVLTMTKSNLGPLAPPLGFRLATDPETAETRIDWIGAQALLPEDLCLSGPVAGMRPRDRAKEWLKELLAGGARKAAEIEAAATAAGIADKTLRRAKEMLKVTSEQRGKGDKRQWWWHDPAVSRPKTADDFVLPPLEEVMPGLRELMEEYNDDGGDDDDDE